MDKPCLKIMETDAKAVLGGKAIALCWPDGTMLGQQVETRCEFTATDYGTITVTLFIDVKTVRVGDEGACNG